MRSGSGAWTASADIACCDCGSIVLAGESHYWEECFSRLRAERDTIQPLRARLKAAEDELHALASDLLGAWDGGAARYGVGTVLRNAVEGDLEDADCAREKLDAVVDAAYVIYRRRVPGPTDTGDTTK